MNNKMNNQEYLEEDKLYDSEPIKQDNNLKMDNSKLIILIINIITEKYIGAVLSNFICVVWWVAIWEMVELQTIVKSDLRWKRLNYQQLYDAKVSFVFEEE